MIFKRIHFPWLKIINIQLMYFYNNTDLFFSFSKGKFRFKNWVERKLSYLNVWSIQVIRKVSQPQWWVLPWGPVDFIMDSGLDESCSPKAPALEYLAPIYWRCCGGLDGAHLPEELRHWRWASRLHSLPLLPVCSLYFMLAMDVSSLPSAPASLIPQEL